MGKVRLSSVLLFALVIPVMMTYRLSPGQTPYWLFGIIFGLLLGNIAIDLYGGKSPKLTKWKDGLTWLVMALVLGSVVVSAILVRHQAAPTYEVHDIIVQQEAAIRYFLQGKNPYVETYFNTPLEQWHYSDTEINPALFHFVMMPGYLLLSLPFRLLSVPEEYQSNHF